MNNYTMDISRKKNSFLLSSFLRDTTSRTSHNVSPLFALRIEHKIFIKLKKKKKTMRKLIAEDGAKNKQV